MPSKKRKDVTVKRVKRTSEESPLHLRTAYEQHGSCMRPVYTHGSASTSTANSVLLPCGDGARLLSWKEEKRKLSTWTLSGEDMASAVALSPTAEVGVVACRSGFVDIVNFTAIEAPTLHKRFRPFERTIAALATFDASGGLVALASRDGNVRVYDVETTDCTHVFRVPDCTITAIEFHPIPERLQLFVGVEAGSVHQFNLATRARAPVVTARHHVAAVTGFAFVEGGKKLVTSSRDSTLCCMRGKDLKMSKIVAVKEPLVDVCTTQNETGRRVIAITEGGAIRTWDMANGSQIENGTLQLPIVRKVDKNDDDEDEDDDEEDEISVMGASVCEHREDGSFKVLVSLSDQTLMLVDIRQDDKPKLIDLMCGNLSEIYDISSVSSLSADDPNAKELVLATNSPTVWVMRPPDNKNKMGVWTCSAGLEGHTGIVLSMDSITATKALGGIKSASSAFVASASRDMTARVWRRSRATGRWSCFAVAKGHTEAIGGVTLSQQTSKGLFYVVTAAADRTLKLWSLDKALEKSLARDSKNDDCQLTDGFTLSDDSATELSSKWTVLAHDKDINSVAVSPDGTLIATGSQDKTMKLWNSTKGKLHAVCRGHRRGLWDVQFSRVDKIVATSSGDATVRIWNVQNGACLRTLEGHLSGVLKSVFITKGTQIASAGADGLIKIWQTRSGECNATVDAHEDRIWALTTVGDGQKLVSGSADGQLSYWEDRTLQKADEAAAQKEQQALMAQKVSNDVEAKRWATAARGALELGMPQKLKMVIEKLIISAEDPDKELVAMVSGLIDEKQESETDVEMENSEQKDTKIIVNGEQKGNKIVTQLCLYVRDWNSTGGPKSAALAAQILQAIFRVWTPDELSALLSTDKRSLVEALAAHVTRHHERVSTLGTKILFMEHILESMKALPDVPTVVKKRKNRDDISAGNKRSKRKKKGHQGVEY